MSCTRTPSKLSCRRITALNKQGIHSMQCGRYNEAIFSFRHALDCLKQQVVRVTSTRKEASEQGSSCSHMEIAAIPLPTSTSPFSCHEDEDDCTTASLYPMSPHNILETFHCAFTFQFVCAAEENDNEGIPNSGDKNLVAQYQVELSMLLFYNQALAHHLVGLQQATDSREHLQEAARYYKIALTIFQSSAAASAATTNTSGCPPAWVNDSNGNADFEVLIMGLLVNLGHVFYHFCQYQEARICLDHLEQLLSVTTSNIIMMDEAMEDFFYMVLDHAQHVQVCVAPAA